MTKTLIIYIIINVLDQVTSTAKTIAVTKCDVFGASVATAISNAFGSLSYIFLFNGSLPFVIGVPIKAVCAGLGTAVVKTVERKLNPDRTWRMDVTVRGDKLDRLKESLGRAGVKFTYVDNLGKRATLTAHFKDKKKLKVAKKIASEYCGRKIFVTESKKV